MGYTASTVAAGLLNGTDTCKICGSTAHLVFALPASKMTGHDIPDEPDDCSYFQCSSWEFCYTRALDSDSHEDIYDDDYWSKQDPDWYGRVGQSFRLVALANELRRGHLADLKILDFGYDPATHDRTWWYFGPGNGHISFYSTGAFDSLFGLLGGRKRVTWNYEGVQAWQFEEERFASSDPKDHFLRKLAKKAGII